VDRLELLTGQLKASSAQEAEVLVTAVVVGPWEGSARSHGC
jgi:hypothetical protein